MEASIVAVRRGMERQYGTGLSVHLSGRSVRGPGQSAAQGHIRRPGETATLPVRGLGDPPRQTASVPEWDLSIASRKRA
ncbi:hypothetical protein SSP531S_19610 [Streptomyces spongiicola]|uniref:Uncharacterized protein n=1 Tax=Streptomyces spongiicola TaxID=1690221 RepID=A0A388SZY8_9ACTN|nr:hypothetical protein SSP531S_19610 [Streptomyces spongiicola]